MPRRSRTQTSLILVSALGLCGAVAVASQPDEDFPPLIAAGSQPADERPEEPEKDPKEESGDREDQKDQPPATMTGPPPREIPEITRVEPRNDSPNLRDPRKDMEVRKEQVEKRWREVSEAMSRGELRPYSATRRSPRFAQDKEMLARSEAVAERARLSDAPVLCPWDVISAGDTKIVSRPDSYAIKTSLADGGSMTISGTCKAMETPELRQLSKRFEARREKLAREADPTKGFQPPPRPMLKKLEAPFDYRRTEYGEEVAFSKFGCAYLLTYYCAEPGSEECMSEKELVAVIDDAILMNGPQ